MKNRNMGLVFRGIYEDTYMFRITCSLVCLLSFLSSICLPSFVYSAEPATTAVPSSVLNAGLVDGLWFSKTPFFAGETIRIYTAFQNQSGFDITGDIVFYNDGSVIAKKSFNSVNGQVIQSWTDWKVTEGNHNVYIEIEEAKAAEIGGVSKSVAIQVKKFDKVAIFADLDTDRDNIGNTVDQDDDGDGISDIQEAEQGTNPLLPNVEKKTGGVLGSILDKIPFSDLFFLKNVATSTTASTSAIVTSTSKILNVIDMAASGLKEYAAEYKSNIDEDLQKNSEGVSVKDSSATSSVKKKTVIENYKAEDFKTEAWPFIYLKGALSLILALFVAILSHRISTYILICFLLYLIWKVLKILWGR